MAGPAADREFDVVERGRLDVAHGAGRPVLAEPFDDQPVEVPLAAVGDDRRLLVEVELLVLVIDLAAEADLPLGRDAIGADAGAELPLLARFFPLERRAPAQTEHPVVPAIPDDGGAFFLRAKTNRDLQLRRHRLAGQHAQQANAERRRQLPADHVIGIRGARDGLHRVGELVVALQAGEIERVLEAAAGGPRPADQDVQIRLGAIAHVIDERDFGAKKVGVAVLAVEEDLQLLARRRTASVLGRGARRRDGVDEANAAGSMRHGTST